MLSRVSEGSFVRLSVGVLIGTGSVLCVPCVDVWRENKGTVTVAPGGGFRPPRRDCSREVMFTSLVRLAADPWSRRQNPVRVPKVTLFQRYPRATVIFFGVAGTSILFSRFIYDVFLIDFFEPDRPPQRELDLIMLLRQTRWRKEGEPPKNLEEALNEQELIREQQRLEKEKQVALATRL
ncbi:uncharacterized protein LOC144116196 [Amblyomma americanum]|uniref:Transmembrane protein n=1 Tax=Amblyomma americanum TaxID=6943 RepID=A0A0C9S9M8_AMBAM